MKIVPSRECAPGIGRERRRYDRQSSAPVGEHFWAAAEFLAHFAHTEVSNGRTETLNLKIKNTKRTARGFRNFGNYRLRLLLNPGRIQNHQTSRIRIRRPGLVA